MRQAYRQLFYCLFLIIFLLPFSFSSAQGSLDYDGSDDFINLPTGIVSSLSGDYTIETWVYWRGASTSSWQRVIDFGTGTNFNMFLTTRNAETGTPRFAITQSSGPGEQRITAPSALSTDAWHHIAVVITNATNTGRLFIDGVDVATNASMTLRPSSLGTTNQNYIGRSQYAPDPYFNGYIEEVRISNSTRYTSDFTPQQSNFSPDANTIALYHFDEGTGQTINDATGNFTGFLGATASSEASDPSWATITALPVGMLNFEANASGNLVKLRWQTAFEQNNKGFYIERSANGTEFSTIGFINGVGNSSSLLTYYYQDPTPIEGKVWYRLRQEDNDGRFQYSNVIALSFESGSNRLYWYTIGQDAIEVRMEQGTNEPYFTSDMNGHILRQGNLSAGKTRLTSLPHGTYIITIITKRNIVLSSLVMF